MPICPGCERVVPYNRLVIHEHLCDGIWGVKDGGAIPGEGLERRFDDLERHLDGRIREIKEDLDRRFNDLEGNRRKQRYPGK